MCGLPHKANRSAWNTNPRRVESEVLWKCTVVPGEALRLAGNKKKESLSERFRSQQEV